MLNRSASLLLAALVVTGAPWVRAEDAVLPGSNSGVVAEFGIGHESQTSPLIRITPEGTLVRLEGFDRLAGAHYRASLSGFAEWPLDQEWRIALGADVRYKKAPGAKALDFVSAAFNPMLRTGFVGGFVGIGPTLQRIDVAGAPFRKADGWHGDWALADSAGNQWLLLLDRAANRHWNDLADLDSTASMLMGKRRQVGPLPGIDAVELEIAVSREHNDRGLRELSNRSVLLRLALERQQWGIAWSVGGSVQRARFDDTAIPTLEPRHDRATTIEFSAEKELPGGQAIRFEATGAANRANLALYENRYRQWSLGYRVHW